MNHSEYFRFYRAELGYNSQETARNYLAGKDIKPKIDFQYTKLLIERVSEIIIHINSKINISCRHENIGDFVKVSIFDKFKIINESGVINSLNNQGRRVEEVLFSWMRGSAIGDYFERSIARFFGVPNNSIKKIGDDKLSDQSIFKRTPKADYEIPTKPRKTRVEIQAGFQGINDIKQHKIIEAKKIYSISRIDTICIHIDIFNGQAAFVNLSKIRDDDQNWVTRQQMEGQTVFSIDQNHFKWRLLDPIPNLKTIEWQP